MPKRTAEKAVEVSLMGIGIENTEVARSRLFYVSLSVTGKKATYARISVDTEGCMMIWFDGLNDMHEDMIAVRRLYPHLLIARNDKELGQSIGWQGYKQVAAQMVQALTGKEVCYERAA